MVLTSEADLATPITSTKINLSIKNETKTKKSNIPIIASFSTFEISLMATKLKVIWGILDVSS